MQTLDIVLVGLSKLAVSFCDHILATSKTRVGLYFNYADSSKYQDWLDQVNSQVSLLNSLSDIEYARPTMIVCATTRAVEKFPCLRVIQENDEKAWIEPLAAFDWEQYRAWVFPLPGLYLFNPTTGNSLLPTVQQKELLDQLFMYLNNLEEYTKIHRELPITPYRSLDTLLNLEHDTE